MNHKKAVSAHLLWLWLALWLLPSLLPVWAQDQSSTPATEVTQPSLQMRTLAQGVALTWQLPANQAQNVTAAAIALQTLPSIRYGGYQLPMHLETVLLDNAAPVTAQFQQVESVNWTATIPVAASLSTPIGDDQQTFAPLPATPLALPTSPLFLLREGRVRGQRIGVFAFSPIYQDAGITKLAQNVQALLPGAQILNSTLPQQVTSRTAVTAQSNLDLPNLDLPNLDPTTIQCCRAYTATSRNAKGEVSPPPGPSNPAAAQSVIKVQVSQPGLQRLTGAALLANGLPTGMLIAQLHLTYRDTELPLEIYAGDGTLDSATELRFYAPATPDTMAVGDRWNRTETYWLRIDPAPGLRMSVRTATPNSAPLRTIGFENGIYESHQFYESTMPGLDGDHWFSEKMSVDPVQDGVSTTYDTKAFVLHSVLPLATSASYTSVLTITGSARTIATHSLRVDLENTGQTLVWTNHDYYENWQKIIVSKVHTNLVNMVLLPGLRPSDIRIDKIQWQQPVVLSFSGQGAVFSGVVGQWLYHLSGTPVDGSLYDITDPYNPQRMLTAWGTSVDFEDGPLVHQYMVAGLGTLFTPQLSAHSPVTFPTDAGADAVYIIQNSFRDALAPLVAYRQKQGYRVMVVDVQDIYDAWNYGQVSPDAIRNFLRYAVHYWNPAPISAVLVGDSTTDPNDYTGNHNPNIIPAYLANVDPWQGEAPCENCYAQLDDDTPLDGPQDPGFLTDIWLGRLSVQTPSELKAVVNKILRYETQDANGRTYSSLYVADDYIHPDGTVDAAGDFAYHSDLVVTGDPTKEIAPLQSPQLPAVRVYYDPTADGTEPWREPDAATARLRVIDELKKGPSLVSFNGHANHYQWASTVRTLAEPYLLGINDIYLLHNFDTLPIVLEMTCYTAQFVQVSSIGVTIDEELQKLPDGGAAAIWGSAGLTVSSGQDALMAGFQTKLWSLPPMTAKMGELITAGYVDLFSHQDCCQEVRKVYLLLGDPLTPARVWTQKPLFLPIIQK